MGSAIATAAGRRGVLLRATRWLASFYGALGILGLLYTEARFGDADGRDFLGLIRIQALGALAYLAISLVGTGMARTTGGARRFLTALAPMMALWVLLGLILNGSPTDLFTRDLGALCLHIATALVAGGLVAWSGRVA